MQRTPPPGYDFDRQQAADYFGCSIKTLDSWAWKRKNLPYSVIAGKAWYRRSDCDRFIAKREVKVQ